MPGWLFAGIVVAFVIVGGLVVRSMQKRAIVERLPVEQDEDILLEEEGLKVFTGSAGRRCAGAAGSPIGCERS